MVILFLAFLFVFFILLLEYLDLHRTYIFSFLKKSLNPLVVIIILLTFCGNYVKVILKNCRLYRILGICYLALKVFLLVLTEIGFFPILCGWWLDICSLVCFNPHLFPVYSRIRFYCSKVMFLLIELTS